MSCAGPVFPQNTTVFTYDVNFNDVQWELILIVTQVQGPVSQTNKHSYQRKTPCPQLEPRKGLQQKQTNAEPGNVWPFCFLLYGVKSNHMP